jgi:hypothetical protein
MSIVARVAACSLALILCSADLAAAEPAAAPAWNPNAWLDESTIELRTTAPGEEPHWFKVWLVVIDGQLYVRLGSRAADRFESNQTRPVLAVRLAGREVPEVTGVAVPDMAQRVDAAMADKYWSDVFVRWFGHPLVLRLSPK